MRAILASNDWLHVTYHNFLPTSSPAVIRWPSLLFVVAEVRCRTASSRRFPPPPTIPKEDRMFTRFLTAPAQTIKADPTIQATGAALPTNPPRTVPLNRCALPVLTL